MHKNNRQKKNNLTTFWQNDQGSFSIFFALTVTTLLGFGALAIDGAHVLNTRVRLSAAADEAVLVIAAINNKNSDQHANEEIAENYLNYYTGNRGNISGVAVEYDSQEGIYYVKTAYDTKSLISSKELTGRDPVMTVGNDRLGSGIAMKQQVIGSADVTFVLDFSSTGTCDINDLSCELWSSTGSNTRTDQLKAVVNSMLNKYKNDSGVQFSIVPFEHGVPFKPKDSIVNPGHDAKNELGGEQLGCSVPYTLKSPYNKIDYTFWANKNLDFNFAKTTLYEKKYDNRIFYNMDAYRHLYYSLVIGPAMGLTTDKQLVSKGLCVDHGYNTSIVDGKYRYSCEINPADSIFTSLNQAKIRSQFNDVVQVMKYMYWTESSARKGEFSIANGGTIDFDATMTNLFKPSNVFEFYQPTAPNVLTQRPFTGMCQSSQAGDNNVLSASDEKATSSAPLYQKASLAIKSAQTQTYLIPLTKSINDKTAMITNFGQMKPGGGTDEMSGLLRAVPIAAQGTGLHKVMIIISDGDNTETNNLPISLSHYKSVTDVFLSKGVCQTIRSELDQITMAQHGLTSLTNPSEIHYVALPTSKATNNNWLTQCADNDPQYIHKASDVSDLLDIVQSIIVTSESGYLNNKK